MWSRRTRSKDLFSLSSLVVASTLLIGFLCLIATSLPAYLDEKIYIECGVSYVVKLTPPLSCNFEHPPLAKYIIGFARLYGFARSLYVVLYAASSLLVFLVIYRLTSSYAASLLSATLLALDTVYYNTHRYLLLDPPALFFALLALYAYLSGRGRLSAALAGLAVACKFSALPIALTLFILTTRSGGFREALVYAGLSVATYLLTYAGDLQLGWNAVLVHHIEIYEYMAWRHGFSTPIAVNGFLRLIARVELWRLPGEYTVLFNASAGSVVSYIFTPIGRSFLIVYTGAGSVLWHLLLPTLLYATYKALTSSIERGLRTLVLLSWASLVNIVAGPLDWYYINALPYLYATTSVLLAGASSRKHGVVMRAILVVTQIVHFSLVVAGIVPYRFTFTH
jgi:4-amino-4-deoxy-L-arabinose transferase-like glycosyltransferase